jgi:hypothetical protein
MQDSFCFLTLMMLTKPCNHPEYNPEHNPEYSPEYIPEYISEYPVCVTLLLLCRDKTPCRVSTMGRMLSPKRHLLSSRSFTQMMFTKRSQRQKVSMFTSSVSDIENGYSEGGEWDFWSTPRRIKRFFSKVRVVIILMNMLMLAPVIVLHIQQPYWCSRHRVVTPFQPIFVLFSSVLPCIFGYLFTFLRAPWLLNSGELCNFLNNCRVGTPLPGCKAPSICTNV